MKCENCKYFIGEPEVDQAPCHRYPPNSIPGMTQGMAGPQMVLQSIFPVVLKGWFCGEYEIKAEGIVKDSS